MPPIAYEMGLRPWEWWRLTPREFHEMVRGYRAAEREKNYRTAILTAAVYNTLIFHPLSNPKKRRKALTPEDFLAGEKGRPHRAQTSEEMLAVVKGLHAAYGGAPRR